MEFKTKQIGWIIIITLLVLMIGFTISVFLVAELGAQAAPQFIATALIFIVLIVLFGSLETTVDSQKITVKFGIGIIKKTISFDEIKNISEVRNKFWYGWGVRLTPHGWLWNIAGYEAVEITYKSGKKSFRIGCRSSKELLKAIKTRM